MPRNLWLPVLVTLLALRCASPGDRCGGELCGAQQRCVAQRCLQSCTAGGPCPNSFVCQDGVCVDAPPPPASSSSRANSSTGPGSSLSTSSSVGRTSSSSTVVDAGCPPLDGGCFINNAAGCAQYKCPYGEVCVTPDDSCVTYPAAPMGQLPGAGQCGIIHAEGHTFMACGLAGTFPQARNYCQTTYPGFDVARPQTAGQQAALAGFLTGGRGWLGLRDVAVEGTFAWVDNATFTYGSFLGMPPWCPTQPDNGAGGNEDCVEFVGAGDTSDCWADLDCLLPDRGVLCSR